LTSAYAGDEDISFGATVNTDDDNGTPDDYTDDKLIAVGGMPYIAGTAGDGTAFNASVAEITSSGATLEVAIIGFKVASSAIINFIKAISVEYGWVDEAV
jgi:hypothetical protein